MDEKEFIWAVDIVARTFRGNLIAPADPNYDSARTVWNKMINKKPLLIAQCRGTADIISIVNLARKHKKVISIRGGGHSISGLSLVDGGIVIDLRLMCAVIPNPIEKTIYVQGGALLEDLDQETNLLGMGVPAGLISETGVGGLTLGGGIGWLSRLYGLTCDNLISVDMINANGDFISASQDSNPDLFWALRGGGGNLGVVTGFKFKCHPINEICFLQYVYEYSIQSKKILKMYADFTNQSLPQNLSVYLWITPDDTVVINAVYVGSLFVATDLVEPLKQIKPISAIETTMPYSKLQSMFDSGNRSAYYYWSRSNFISSFDDKVIDKLLITAKKRPNNTTIEIMHLGGAISDVLPTDTPFYFRNATHEIHSISKWTTEDQKLFQNSKDWAREFSSELQKVTDFNGGYVNFNIEGSEPKKHFGENYERLKAIKEKYDPTNFFHST